MDGRIPVLGANGLQPLPVADVLAEPVGQIAALQAALTKLTARVVVLEGRPEEVAHFSASAKLPALAALSTFNLTLTGLVPARAGDVLKAGERVSVAPTAPLPDGLALLTATVPSDNTVLLRISAGLALAAGSSPVVWGIAALR